MFLPNATFGRNLPAQQPLLQTSLLWPEERPAAQGFRNESAAMQLPAAVTSYTPLAAALVVVLFPHHPTLLQIEPE